jgi:outer membrane protein assembly factor BamA
MIAQYRPEGSHSGTKCRPLKLAAMIVMAFQTVAFAHAEDPQSKDPKTRIEWIIEKQKEKARNLVPAKSHPIERKLFKYVGENPLNKYMGGIPGLHLRFGGLPTGSGFALGPEYFRPDLTGGQMALRASAIGSMKQWYMLEMELHFPYLFRQYLDLRLKGHRLDANSVDYYGRGPESDKSGRTQYRREENGVNASLGCRPTRRYLSLGFDIGYLWINVGPGQSSLYNSTERQYSPSEAPGIDRQTYYLYFGPFGEFDSRDKPQDPHSGTHFRVAYSHYMDKKFDTYSFQRIHGLIEQYIPFFNKKRVVAVRVSTSLNYGDKDNKIPFYMQPTLGGASDLRGYQRYRFYDNNSFLMNIEYRWEVFTIMDAAVFADMGKVFSRDGDFNFKSLESDAGFGFRFKTRRAVVFRMDTAFSHEGYGLWLTFDHIF